MENIQIPNLAALKELRAQVSMLASKLDEVIDRNELAITLCARGAVKFSSTAEPTSKPSPVSKDVHFLLVLAGEEGATSTKILRELENRRSVTWSAVRQALNRLRTNGKARRVGRLWYPV